MIYVYRTLNQCDECLIQCYEGDERPVGGGSSYISNNDGNFIELKRRKDKGDFSDRRISSSHETARAVSRYESIVPSVIIDRQTTLAKFSGLEVRRDIIREGKVIKLQQCQKLCQDLMELYFNGIYIKDIHPGNLVVENETAPVKLIDTVDTVHPESEYVSGEVGCPNYFTLALKKGREEGDYNLIRVAEQYSLALTICYITDKTGDLRKAIKEHNWRNESQLGYNCFQDLQYNQAFKRWARQHILPEFFDAFCHLLENPTEFDPTLHVSSMFNWSKDC